MRSFEPSLSIDWAWVKKELFRSQRISPKKSVGLKDDIRRAALDCLRQAKALVAPRMISAIFPVTQPSPALIQITPSVRISGKRLAAYLRKAAEAYIFAVTIGPKVEAAATKRMHDGDALGGYLLDKIGSLAVESLAESVEDRVRLHYARTGRSLSGRFSPGYCDWPIEEQHILDKILGFRKAGIRLTESFMMVPRKSISALMGIGPHGTFTKAHSPCIICTMKECTYRRAT